MTRSLFQRFPWGRVGTIIIPISQVKTVRLGESAGLAQLPAVENCRLFLHHRKCPRSPTVLRVMVAWSVGQARRNQGRLLEGGELGTRLL